MLCAAVSCDSHNLFMQSEDCEWAHFPKSQTKQFSVIMKAVCTEPHPALVDVVVRDPCETVLPWGSSAGLVLLEPVLAAFRLLLLWLSSLLLCSLHRCGVPSLDSCLFGSPCSLYAVVSLAVGRFLSHLMPSLLHSAPCLQMRCTRAFNFSWLCLNSVRL